MKKVVLLTVLSAILILLGCTDQEGTKCDVMLQVELKEVGDGYLDISLGAPPNFKTIIITSVPKNPEAILGSLQDVEVTKIVAKWTRADGGTITPKPYTLLWTTVVPAGGNSTLTGTPVMGLEQLTEMPFKQLLPENGGRDQETGLSIITCNVEITVYGRTLNGCDIESQHASCTFQFFCSGGR